MRQLRPPRPVAPATPKIRVTRDFEKDFNKLSWFFDWELADIELEKSRIRIHPPALEDVPRMAKVIRALEVVAKHYGWTDDEFYEWRGPLRHPGPNRDYILNLANAVQHGYRQTLDNNYQRLATWLAEQGLEAILSEGAVHEDAEHE
jgi:hypothetical protein